ncbi:carbon monoxide dehydrogenase CooS subunit [Desulfocucumis palustris]|uniref:Carbon monoxide dehydrogenase n=1 Tax=Desulfocucumis palustris TaxID=1898651 RepID=A0A2L2XFM2_9FIRM|nr:anaerobic carbon-monoxide dehydrogenase catalytic subunit [Desulfocucumis palustris]GBF35038.1 carbon monoxide dehydrogenase CooS subunit [Desulfocucumis palustris]
MRVCISADQVLNDFLAARSGVETSFNRVPPQAVKCGFGMQGVCCRLCSNGPCRITPKSPRGVCGASPDTMVARNFLRAVAAGAACYLHIVENAAVNLREIGRGNSQLPLKGTGLLNELADSLETGGRDRNEKAVNLAERVLADLYLPRNDKMRLVQKLAYGPRFELWRQGGLLPGGAKSEVFDALVKTSTNLSSDPVDMLLHSLRLGIATGLYGLAMTNKINDIIWGEPQIRTARAGFGVVDPDYVNIMITGHQQSLAGILQDALLSPEAADMARAAGAAGFRIIGSTCVGQDMQLRAAHCPEVFAGQTGNNFTTEALVATGAIDLVVSEFNCTLPGMETVCRQMLVPQICLDDVAKKQNAELLPFDIRETRAIAGKIMRGAADSFAARRKNVTVNVPSHGYDDVLTGLSEKTLKNFLGGSYKPLIDLIAAGSIKGIAAVVGCSNLTAGGHDIFTVGMTRELIKRDIIVLSAGCTSGALENVGLMSPAAAELAGESLKKVCLSLGIPPVLNFGPCLAIGRLEETAADIAAELGVDLPKLPLIISAPQWLEEQALADGAFGLALGLTLHLAIPPFITGSELVTGILTKGLENITGGRVIVDGDINSTVDRLEAVILDKRAGLGL